MHKLEFVPNVSVGPFIFGMEQSEVHKIIKGVFKSESEPQVERDLPSYESEYYPNPDIHVEYKNKKLISVFFIDDIRQRYCEIYLNNEKIWPRTKKKFFSIFGQDSFVELYDSFSHNEFSLCPNWENSPPSLVVGQKGYCAELVETQQLVDIVFEMRKGMTRDHCRMLIGRKPEVSADGMTDNYPHGTIKPEIMSLTYGPDNLLLRASHSYPNGHVINIVK